MNNRWLNGLMLVSATWMLSCCGTAPEVPRGPAQQHKPSSHVVDAPAGEHEEFSGKLDASPRHDATGMRVVIKMVRLQPSEKWAPTIMFCLGEKHLGSSHCLNTYATRDGTRLVAKLLDKQSEAADVETTRLPFDLVATDDHYLDIVLARDRLVMIIDDEKFFDRPLAEPVDEYWFSCSSVVCSVEVLYPYHGRE